MNQPRHELETPSALDNRACERARLSRDARFDGLFYTAVSSTGIYCRPVCPAPPPKPENVRYFRSAAVAESHGYRPCLRCRPELSPTDNASSGDHAVVRALALIDAGALDDASLEVLAEQVGLGERQLRRLFVEHVGTTPSRVAGTRRLLFSKQLLTETNLPITDVAMAAGFGSLRRFNASFREAYRLAPRDLRRGREEQPGEALKLKLAFRPPYDFDGLLAFFALRALPGVEFVDTDSYQRSIGRTNDGASAWFRLSRGARDNGPLQLELHDVPMRELGSVVTRVRRMFDMDADPARIEASLGSDPAMRRRIRRHPGLRIPGAWDGFEIAVRAVLGQQVSVAAARTIASRIVQRHGAPLTNADNPEITHRFPGPEVLVDADLTELGMTRRRAETVRAVAAAVLDGRIDFARHQSLDDFVARWCALPGIGPWTASYVALRGLGHPDAFLDGDLILRRAAADADDAEPLTNRQLLQRAERWRPWRGYAVFHLWRDSPTAEKTSRSTSKLPATNASGRVATSKRSRS